MEKEVINNAKEWEYFQSKFSYVQNAYTHMDMPPYPFEVTYKVEIEKGWHPDCTPRVEEWCYITNYKPLNNTTTEEKETKDFGFRVIFLSDGEKVFDMIVIAPLSDLALKVPVLMKMIGSKEAHVYLKSPQGPRKIASFSLGDKVLTGPNDIINQ